MTFETVTVPVPWLKQSLYTPPPLGGGGGGGGGGDGGGGGV